MDGGEGITFLDQRRGYKNIAQRLLAEQGSYVLSPVECKSSFLFTSPSRAPVPSTLAVVTPSYPLFSLSLSEKRGGSGIFRFKSQPRYGRSLCCPPSWLCSLQLVPAVCHRTAAGQRPSRGWGFSGFPRLCCRVPRDTDTPCLLLRCLRILSGGPGEDWDACGARKLLGSGRGPGGGSAAGAAGAALQKGRRMGRSWGAGGRGRRGLKGRRTQVGLPRSLATRNDPVSDFRSLPYPTSSRARDPTTVSIARRLGGCRLRGCWEEGTSLRDPRKFPGSAWGPEPSVSPSSLFRRCGNTGWR